MKDNPEPYSPRQLQFQKDLAFYTFNGKGLPLNYFKCHGRQRYNNYKSLMNMIIRHNTYKDKVQNSLLPRTHYILCDAEYNHQDTHKCLYLVEIDSDLINPDTVNMYRNIKEKKEPTFCRSWEEVLWYVYGWGENFLNGMKFVKECRSYSTQEKILPWMKGRFPPYTWDFEEVYPGRNGGGIEISPAYKKL